MASKKISELTSATTPLGPSDLVEVVQGGVNKKAPKSAFGLQSVQAGTNVTIDDTDPSNPIINASGGGGSGTVESVTGDGVDNTDPANPVITNIHSATALTDAASIDLTAIKHTLATSSSRTFTISYTGDDITMEVTLNATSATQTFPAGSLCVSEGIATGDNTCPMAGVSGDKYMFAIKKIDSAYYVVCKNFGQ